MRTDARISPNETNGAVGLCRSGGCTLRGADLGQYRGSDIVAAPSAAALGLVRLAEAGAAASVGSIGDSNDNALAELLNSLFKAALVRR